MGGGVVHPNFISIGQLTNLAMKYCFLHGDQTAETVVCPKKNKRKSSVQVFFLFQNNEMMIDNKPLSGYPQAEENVGKTQVLGLEYR